MKIFVGNLSPEVNEEELNTLFSEHGNVSMHQINCPGDLDLLKCPGK
jgi:RNA recognition motif-containing protein